MSGMAMDYLLSLASCLGPATINDTCAGDGEAKATE